MSREKSIFEQMGGTYTEKGGIYIPISLLAKKKQKQCKMLFQENTEIYGKSI